MKQHIKSVILSGTKWSRRISILSLFAFIACTDYVQDIEDQRDEWREEQAKIESSSETNGVSLSSIEETTSSSFIEPSNHTNPDNHASSSSVPPAKNSSSSNTAFSSNFVSSSSKEASSSSVTAEGAWAYLNPDIAYGELTDSRDGQIYKTVVIGRQTWMAQNLNYEYNKQTAISYYNTQKTENRSIYGLLYTWAAAMDSVNSGCGYETTCGADYNRYEIGVCPDGWRLPNNEDWDELYRFANRHCSGDDVGTCLKSKDLWFEGKDKGTNRLGFSALPASHGQGAGDNSNILMYGPRAYFWSSTEYGETGAYTPWFDYDESILNWHVHTKNYGFSIRCIKDEPHESLNDSSIGSLYYELGRELVDLRDGQVYKTSAIGEQIWMAQNLNFETDSSICYGNSLDSCKKYGRLYQWYSAMGEFEISNKIESDSISNNITKQGVCPGGWHLPSEEEWQELIETVGGNQIAGTKLKSSSGWYGNNNGDNYNYFNMKPSGSRNQYGFSAARYGASIWTSSEQTTDSATSIHFSTTSSINISVSIKTNYMGIRCLKNSF